MVMTGYDNLNVDKRRPIRRVPRSARSLPLVRGTNHPHTGMPTFVRFTKIRMQPVVLGRPTRRSTGRPCVSRTSFERAAERLGSAILFGRLDR